MKSSWSYKVFNKRDQEIRRYCGWHVSGLFCSFPTTISWHLQARKNTVQLLSFVLFLFCVFFVWIISAAFLTVLLEACSGSVTLIPSAGLFTVHTVNVGKITADYLINRPEIFGIISPIYNVAVFLLYLQNQVMFSFHVAIDTGCSPNIWCHSWTRCTFK